MSLSTSQPPDAAKREDDDPSGSWSLARLPLGISPPQREFSWLTLNFPPDLEQEFRRDYARKSLWHFRLGIGIAFALWVGFGILDNWIVPDVKHGVWLIRYAIVAPFLILGFLFSHSRHFGRFMQAAAVAIFFNSTFCLTAMVDLVIQPAGAHPYTAGLLLALPCVCVVFRLRFVHGVWASLVALLVDNAAAIWLTDIPAVIIVSNNFFAVSASILGLVAGYNMEVYIRRDFLLRRAAERSIEQLEALREIGQSVGSTLDVDRVLTTTVTHAVELCNANGGVIYEFDDDDEKFHFRASHRVEPKLIEALRAAPLGREEGVIGQAAAALAPVQIPDIANEPGVALPRARGIIARSGYRSLLAVPLLRERRIMGALVIGRREVGSFSPESVNLLQMFATQSGLAIQNARLFREIEEKSRQLESANLAKSRFLAAASHDLRQPLHALGLFVAQLRGGADAAEQGRLVERIESCVAAMNQLFNALLDIARLDAGVLTPTRTEFPLAQLLPRIETNFAGPARQKGLRLRVLPSAAWISSDSILLERILLNLVSNAVRYTSRGGVLVACRKRGGTVRIEVLDTGPGIAESQRQNIFNEFFRLADTGGDRQGGLGLGLSIVERLCRLLDHPIELTSTVGKGSRFSIIVPSVGARAEVAVAVPPVAPNGMFGKTVVVIDDDALVLDGMGGLLRGWSCNVVTAPSHAAALAGLDRTRPDLIISDYRLADGMTGIEVIARLRDTFGAAIPAFLISGDTAPERLREARASGHHLLHKPVQPMALRALLGQLLKS